MAFAKQKSANVSNRRRKGGQKDERVRRTRQRIDGAFVELLHRRPYGDIRVSDITKKAGVGRATFYAHYSAKDDLLRSQFERVVAPMLVASADDPRLLDASRLFAHIGSAPHFYRALMGPSGGTAPRVLRQCFEDRAREALLLGRIGGSGLKQLAMCRFVASSLLTIIECWLEQGSRETPVQVQALFTELVGQGLGTQDGTLRRTVK